MTAAVLGDRGLPWTEEDYLALGETKDRVELLDGSLLVSPVATPGHQTISSRLYMALLPAVEAAGLEVYEAINVRLRRGRIPIPDLAIVEPIDPDVPVVDVAAVRLVCEIVSPNNPAADRVLKMQLYAEAGIGWYLLVEQESEAVLLRLFRLDGDHFTEHGAGAPWSPLTMDEPVTVTLDPAGLLPRRTR